MGNHAKFSPSKMESILLCPATVRMTEALAEQDLLPPPSSYAEHGTKLHHYVHVAATENDKCVEDLEIDDRGAVNDCIEYLRVLINSLGHKNYSLKFEVKASLASWGLPEVWGTTDVYLRDNEKHHVHIIDWKFGSGVWVSAYRNEQLMTYAAGSIQVPTRTKKITLHVVQPFLDNYSTYDMTFDELFGWVHTDLAMGINRAKQEYPEFNPGVKQCRWCPGKNHCNARFNWARENATRIFRNHEFTNSIPQEEMIELIELGPEIDRAIKGYKQFVTNEMQKGREYDGLKLVEGRSIRKWKVDEPEILQWVEENTKIDPMDLIKSKVASPAQVEKLDRRLKKDEAFQELFEKPQGKATLVPESDPRTALKPQNQAVDIFADYVEKPDKLE
jgi:hypothetical protein